ncbi:hypothetical protein C8R47DRAFT_1107259 [Mycena vitilis]|nr:hypothetical protein C8R47DRAFT_1107259 [Mycena vitilis]
MSSSEEEARPLNVAHKKRKGHRPCDMCRRKKRRCDGGDPCERCVKHDLLCTYQQKSTRRISPSYVRSLEARLETVEALIRESNSSGAPPQQLETTTPPNSGGAGVPLMARDIQGQLGEVDHVPPLASPQQSPFIPSGIRRPGRMSSSSQDLVSRDGSGVPQSNSALAWSEYDYEMLNHQFGPGEAPARPTIVRPEMSGSMR